MPAAGPPFGVLLLGLATVTGSPSPPPTQPVTLRLADCAFTAEPGGSSVRTTCTLDQVASLAQRIDALERTMARVQSSINFPPEAPPPASPPPPPMPPTPPPPLYPPPDPTFESLVTNYQFSSMSPDVVASGECTTTSCGMMWSNGVTCMVGAGASGRTEFGWGDTGNADGTNYIIFTMSRPIRLASIGGTTADHTCGGYWGTARLYGSNDASNWAQLATLTDSTSFCSQNIGNCMSLGPSTISDASPYSYYKFSACCNGRGTYHHFSGLHFALA